MHVDRMLAGQPIDIRSLSPFPALARSFSSKKRYLLLSPENKARENPVSPSSRVLRTDLLITKLKRW